VLTAGEFHRRRGIGKAAGLKTRNCIDEACDARLTLIAGNVLGINQAGFPPQCAIALERVLADAVAPTGPCTNLMMSHAQSDRMVDYPRIKGVALTGSVAAGRRAAHRHRGHHL
jgi:acyl-CoA reductase-like NAD-dependent aldehyde dehydrogenase